MELSSTEQDLTEMIPAGLIRALQHEDQINVPKRRKSLEAQHERNVDNFEKTHL